MLSRKMCSGRKEYELQKLSQELLLDLFDRQSSILKNRVLLERLPDKGKHLRENLEKVNKEIKLREDVKAIEQGMTNLAVTDFRENHVQHICKLEKMTIKDRYKPFMTLIKPNQGGKEIRTITLTESMTLLEDQSKRLKETQLAVRLGTYKEENNVSSSSSSEDGEETEPT